MKQNKLAVVLLVYFCVCALLAGCREDVDSSTVAIQGTVTITRNGVPWNKDNFPMYDRRNNHGRKVGSPPPAVDRPRLTAYSKEQGYIGAASVSYDIGSADYTNGKYRWTLSIPEDKLPCSVYFTVKCPMRNVYGSKSVETEEFLIDNKNTVTDIGPVNFNVVRLSGNLPITINGEAPDAYTVGRLYIIRKPNTVPLYDTYIGSDGDWSLNIYQPESEIPATFQVETKNLGGIFEKTLNPADTIMIYDTDLEVTFPDFERVNFEALVLSGTLKLPVKDGRRLNMYLYYGDYTGSNHDTVLSWQDIAWPEPDKNGFLEWKTMIPVYPFPFGLTTRTELIKDADMNHINRYKSNKSIVITDTTNLSNIDLGDLRL